MKLGIMQPYFFPYLGYFDLINRTDQWVAFDAVKYKPKSWMNRNRILHPSDGWQYISIPVNKHMGQGNIADVLVIDKGKALEKLLGQIQHYQKGRAPYFNQVTEIIHRCFAESTGDKLRDLNTKSLEVVCNYLDIDFKYDILSQMDLKLPDIKHPGQWALEISTLYGANEYINPPAGKEIFRPEEFRERNIKLGFTELVDFHYDCGKYDFIERLSILDVLMWNDPGTIKEYLDNLNDASTSHIAPDILGITS